MLLQDEQYVIKWLSQYGALTKTQVIRLLRDKRPQAAEKIIRNLQKQMRVAGIAGGYYLGLDSMIQPDQRMILAVWVLLRFIARPRMARYSAVSPNAFCRPSLRKLPSNPPLCWACWAIPSA